MTIEKTESIKTNSKTNYSQNEILDIFKGVGQVEIPTRDQVLASKNNVVLHIKEKKSPRYIIQKPRKRPSTSYLNNLNPRIAKADTLWHNLWGRERGELVRYCGIENSQEIQRLANESMVPECVINKFISGAM